MARKTNNRIQKQHLFRRLYSSTIQNHIAALIQRKEKQYKESYHRINVNASFEQFQEN